MMGMSIGYFFSWLSVEWPMVNRLSRDFRVILGHDSDGHVAAFYHVGLSGAEPCSHHHRNFQLRLIYYSLKQVLEMGDLNRLHVLRIYLNIYSLTAHVYLCAISAHSICTYSFSTAWLDLFAFALGEFVVCISKLYFSGKIPQNAWASF